MSNYRTIDTIELSNIFNALSNHNRLKIFLKLISCCKETGCEVREDIHTCVGELGKDLEIAQSTVSHHIKELVRTGLIKTKRQGNNVRCWVDPETLSTLTNFYNKLIKPKKE